MLTTNIPKLRIPHGDYDWLIGECRRLLNACRVSGPNGAVLYAPVPPGPGGTLRTREFCYMVEGAGQLIPPDHIAAGIDTLLGGQREDGVIPERVSIDGGLAYCAGSEEEPLGSGPPTDNAQFLVKLVAEHLRLTDDFLFFGERLEALQRALESVPVTDDGAVHVDPASPHPAYGFTDTVAKTGGELFSTLLLWEAWQLVGRMCRRLEDHDAAHDAYEQAERAQRALVQFWDEEYGMLVAATYDCRQLDLWGSAYAVRVGAVRSRQRKAIAAFFGDLYPDCVRHGHVRHLVAGQYWERMQVEVPPDTGQNGGYWAIPSGWVARCLLASDEPDLAGQLVRELIEEFRTNGVCRWISEREHASPGYVASIALLLDAVKGEGSRRD